jgi:hypothetical protein
MRRPPEHRNGRRPADLCSWGGRTGDQETTRGTRDRGGAEVRVREVVWALPGAAYHVAVAAADHVVAHHAQPPEVDLAHKEW